MKLDSLEGTFDKGYTPNWTEEVFTISDIQYTDPITYKITDLNNQPIEGSFYEAFNKESIYNTLKALKSGKAPGIDGIPNEFLKYGGETMVHSLSSLFTVISDFEQVPEEWQRGIIKPIHKSGSLYDLDNYRGITLTSNVYKLFSKTLESIVVDYLESNDILGECQGAFRKDRRLEDHIFTLQGICSLAKSSKKPLYVAFLDLSKAFDRVWRDGLFANLWNSGIQGKCWRLIQAIYKNVENKVLFGDFESDWFDQEFGVKQGCTLSPTLFSVLMNDLVQMLNNSNIGVEISSKIINCLLFADDVVLFANSPDELQELLRISYEFANKWNLRFNPKKSKVLVMGKKPKEKFNWRLGNETIDEATEYKYLGCFIDRSLKPNFHVNTFLKNKAENHINYMIRILGEHGDFNRINFGTSLWNSILRPSLTHACAIWMPLSLSSRDALNSWQYKAAKVVLRTKLNIPRSALLLELGWEPITTFIDRQRILYFKRLSDLPDSRLCKQVYNEMVRSDETFWNYKGHVDRTIHELDSNNLLYENIHVGAVNNAFGLYARGNLLLDVFSKSSLDFYQTCFVGMGKQKYLNNINFQASRLKLLGRTKTLPLRKYLRRMNMVESDCCLFCNSGKSEDLEHFLLECTTFSDIRDIYFKIFDDIKYDLNINFMELSPGAKLQFLIGDIGYLFNDDIGLFFDHYGMLFLNDCFKRRCELFK